MCPVLHTHLFTKCWHQVLTGSQGVPKPPGFVCIRTRMRSLLVHFGAHPAITGVTKFVATYYEFSAQLEQQQRSHRSGETAHTLFEEHGDPEFEHYEDVPEDPTAEHDHEEAVLNPDTECSVGVAGQDLPVQRRLGFSLVESGSCDYEYLLAYFVLLHACAACWWCGPSCRADARPRATRRLTAGDPHARASHRS